MIRTVVCEKEGCSGNTFLIETQGNNLVLTCEHCKSKYEFDISYYDFIILSNCSKCNNDTFKVFRDSPILRFRRFVECMRETSPERQHLWIMASVCLRQKTTGQ